MTDMENAKLLKLYELAINEEHHFLEQHQSRIAFYSGIVSALVAGTADGLFQASNGIMWQFFVQALSSSLLYRLSQLMVLSVCISGFWRQ
jgi:hypothetical protein